MNRFAVEAKVTGARSSNILAVHDIGNHEDAPCIVAELLEGKELRIAEPACLAGAQASD